jgi:serine/threonine-protein phosphatase 6 regulatory ankyrin repeat subunit B
MNVYDAVESKNAPLVTELVASGVDVNHVTAEGLTPLIRALQLQDEASVLALLERALLNWFPQCATSPLATAVECYPEMVPTLIEKGASLRSYISPITAAVKANDPKMIDYLLSKGAPINGGDIPPLHQAVLDGNLAMVELLLAEGAFIDWQNSVGTTALLLATSTEEPQVEVIQVLLDRQANIEIGNLNGRTPLISAAGYGDTEIVDLLLRYDADVGHANNKGATPLHLAVYANSMVCAHMLLTQGADLNAADVNGNSPLMLAFRCEDSDDMVAMLLDMKANVNSVSANGLTVLHRAISNENAGMVATLLRRGATVNHPLPDGATPLHTAVFLQNSEIVDILLQFQANVDRPMADGTAPLHSAVRMPSLDIAKRLLDHGCSQGGALHIAAERGGYDHTKLLLRYKAEVNAVDRYGAAPIKYAIENEHVNVTVLLVSAGALFSPNQIPDFAPYRTWASRHTAELTALETLCASPPASRLCLDLQGVITTFLLLPNVTALAWRVVESI